MKTVSLQPPCYQRSDRWLIWKLQRQEQTVVVHEETLRSVPRESDHHLLKDPNITCGKEASALPLTKPKVSLGNDQCIILGSAKSFGSVDDWLWL